MERIKDTKISRSEWKCGTCEAINHVMDGECQFCECEGEKCTRWNCSGSCCDVEVN